MGNKAPTGIRTSSRTPASGVPHKSRAASARTTASSSSSKSNSGRQPQLDRTSSQHSTLQEAISLVDNIRDVYDCYERVDHISDGSTCSIWSVRKKQVSSSTSAPQPSNTDTTLYAMKVITKRSIDDIFLKEMKNEIAIMRGLDHPNIARVYDTFESADEIYLVMELCSGGDLLSRAPYRSEAQIAKVLTKVLSAVAYLHQNKTVHRDIKVENVIYESKSEDAEPKLIDFGISKRHISHTSFQMHCQVGTLATMSPEVIKGDYSYKTDLWSVGVVAYQLLSGKQPFNGETNKKTIQMILDGEYSMEGKEWNRVSQEAKDFCASLLEYDPSKRKSAPQALNSPWLKRLFPLHERSPDPKVMTLVHDALIHSSNDSRFKKLVNMMIAYKMDSTELLELRSAFDALDTNNQGTINYWEFRTALQRCNYTDKQLKDIFKGIDVNETGVINYTEFLAATLQTQGDVETELIMQAFDHLDQDNSGFISKENICTIFGGTCSAENCDAMVAEVLEEVDTHKDGTFVLHLERPLTHLGRISYDEFLTLFREKRDDMALKGTKM